MKRSPLTRRYARALFELAREEGCLAAVEADAGALVELVRDRETFARLLDPRASRRRAAVWSELLSGKVHPLTLRFVLFVLDKGRGALLDGMMADFIDLCHESRGIQPIEIVAATPLSDAQVQSIIDHLAQRLRRELRAVVRVDTALLGGFKVHVRDTIYDFSLNHQLERLHRSLLIA